MPLALLLVAALTVDAVDTAPPPEPSPPVPRPHSSFSSGRLMLIGLTAGVVAIGAGGALGALLDRDGAFGRACAITTGTLGTALFGADVGLLIGSLVYPARPSRPTRDPEERFGESLADGFSALGIVIVSILGGLAGLAVGAVGSALASGPPGTQRGVLGFAGGGVMIVAAVPLAVVLW